MSQTTDLIERTIETLQALLEPVTYGTVDRKRTVPRVDRAVELLRDFSPTALPVSQVGPPRGGSSSPRETEDRGDAQRVSGDCRRLPEVLAEIPLLSKQLVKNVRAAERLAAEADLIVNRTTRTADVSKLPSDATVPGCVSCARLQRPGVAGSGFFQPVAAPDPHGPKRWGLRITASLEKHPLCQFCRTHAVANALEAGDHEVTREHYPLLRAVDLLNRETVQAAGRWLAQERARAAARKRSA